MKWLRAVGMSFALYSRVPMPPLDWESESRRLTLYVFPLVGLAVSAAWAVWLALCWALELGTVLRAVGMTLLPILVTGGIHPPEPGTEAGDFEGLPGGSFCRFGLCVLSVGLVWPMV